MTGELLPHCSATSRLVSDHPCNVPPARFELASPRKGLLGIMPGLAPYNRSVLGHWTTGDDPFRSTARAEYWDGPGGGHMPKRVAGRAQSYEGRITTFKVTHDPYPSESRITRRVAGNGAAAKRRRRPQSAEGETPKRPRSLHPRKPSCW